MSFFSEHKNDLLQLVIIILISVVMYFMVFLVSYKSYLTANWPDYRCNPMFMPLAGMLNIPDNTSDTGFLTVSKNIHNCLGLKMSEKMGEHLKPAHNGLALLGGGLGDMSSAFSGMSGMFGGLKSELVSFGGGIMSKIDTAKSLMSYYIIKFNELLKKIFAVFMTLIYVMKASESTLMGLVEGPIGQGIDDFVCFIGQTKIILNNGVEKCIKDIQNGDILEGDNRVIGIIESIAPKILYKYNDIIVSGSHLVYENSKWIKVEESDNKDVIINHGYSRVYNLVTENNMININNTLFRDYSECSNSVINNHIREYIIKEINNDLNNNLENNNLENNNLENNNLENIESNIRDNHKTDLHNYDNNDYYSMGYISNSLIELCNGRHIEIKDINVGDNIKYAGNVLSKIEYDLSDVDVINNLYDIRGVIMSGNNIIKRNSKWDYASNLGSKVEYSKLEDICKENNMNIKDFSLYSLSTESGHVYVSNNNVDNKILSVDINETYKIDVNANVEELIQNYLNGKLSD